MYTPEQLSSIIETECDQLPLNQQPECLFRPIKYIMSDGGKRIRPMLVLLSANIFSGNLNPAIGSALAIELFHNFTLLHDDIMDKASIRRGRDTVHVKWNENTAILSGDAMFSLAYDALCRDSYAQTMKELLIEFNRVTLEVCKGQQYDMDFEKRVAITIEEYKQMIELKTAILFAVGMKMGAISANATDKQRSAIYDFGLNLGMAFQIQDDWLDTYGDRATFGKDIGGDIAVGKQTYLKIRAYELASKNEARILETSRNFEEVIHVYDNLNISTMTQDAISGYFDVAISILNDCHEDKARLEPLREYAHTMMNRQR